MSAKEVQHQLGETARDRGWCGFSTFLHSSFAIMVASWYWWHCCQLKPGFNAAIGWGGSEDTTALTSDESFPRRRKEVRKIRKLNHGTSPQGWKLLVFVPALMCLYALFSLLLDLGAVCVHMLSRRCDHELKRRLMSQDMEAQTPICSQSHSGGCVSTKPHSVTE